MEAKLIKIYRDEWTIVNHVSVDRTTIKTEGLKTGTDNQL